MEINGKMIKPIQEVKYLSADNAWRYRTILRFFYIQYEKIKYWMYKEEVWEELKKHSLFRDYTMEQCKQDLDVLVEWGNLIPIQDTSKVSTVEEFKNKQFRYQLSEYTVEIERMAIRLENIFVEGASLEPTLLERIKNHLEKFHAIVEEDIKSVGIWWRDLNTDFKRLNQNYQDYIRELHSIKAEEMMKTREFLVFKDKFIDYLRDFIKELQKNTYGIEGLLREIDEEKTRKLMEKVFAYEQSIPRIDMEVRGEDIFENIRGRWRNLQEWFLGSPAQKSEREKLFEITNEIIRKITRFAAQIAESRNSAANRKEEYKKLCEMFLACEETEDAHKLSSLAFGIFHTKHIQGSFYRKTESINSGVFDEEPFEIEIKPRIRAYREKSMRTPIENHHRQKQNMLQQYIQMRQQEKNIIESYICDQRIDFSALPKIESHVRATLLRWLSKGMNSPNKRAKTEDGHTFRVVLPDPKKRCILRCNDGDLEMPAFIIQFD